MERIQSAFNGKANTDDSKDDQHGNPIYAGRLNQRHSLLGRTHKQVSGHIIEQAQPIRNRPDPSWLIIIYRMAAERLLPSAVS